MFVGRGETGRFGAVCASEEEAFVFGLRTRVWGDRLGQEMACFAALFMWVVLFCEGLKALCCWRLLV